MDLKVINQKGKSSSRKVKLDESVFGSQVNEYLLDLSVYVYLSNQRKPTAHVKTRSEVRGGGAKPWKQKGTGRARHGSIRSPIWKGGGVVFGPRKDANYKKKLSRKMKKNAIRSAFSLFIKNNRISIVDKIEIKNKKLTKQVLEIAANITDEKKVLFIIDIKGNRNLMLGSRNLKDVNVINTNGINVYELLKHDYLIIEEGVLDTIKKNWGVGIKKESKSTKEVSPIKTEKKKEETKDKKVRSKPRSIEDLKLNTRVVNALKAAGVSDVKKLRKLVENDEKIEGIGEKSLQEIKKAIK